MVAEALKHQRFKYPELRRDDTVIDDYYGIKVCVVHRKCIDVTSSSAVV